MKPRPGGWCLPALLGLVLLWLLGPAMPADKDAAAPRFEADVLPLFKAKCLRCHGDKTRKADLDLRTAAGVLRGGDSGPAVVAGKPDESLLYEKVHGGEMPPGKKDRLTQDEVAVIRRWIAGGAASEKAKDKDAAL